MRMVLWALGVGVSLGLGWRFVWWFVLAGCCGILFVEFGCWICVLFLGCADGFGCDLC